MKPPTHEEIEALRPERLSSIGEARGWNVGYAAGWEAGCEAGVREFAEWLLLEGITLDDSDMFSGRVTPISAATRFLAETGKEPK